MHCPPHLKAHFDQFQPFFKRCSVSRGMLDDTRYMKKFVKKTNSVKNPVPCLLLSYFTKKALMLTAQVQWYLEHGMIIDKIHTVYTFKPEKCFDPFVSDIADARRAGDLDPTKKVISDLSKYLGNASIGKSLLQRTNHKNVHYCDDSKACKLVNDPFFHEIDQIAEGCHEVSMTKKKVLHRRFKQQRIGM